MLHSHAIEICLLLVISSTILACSPAPRADRAQRDLELELDAILARIVTDNAAIHGVALSVQAPAIGLRYSGAEGLADPEAGTPMSCATPVRIASNTKTYVAAAILRLAEDERLDIDDPIARWLTAEHAMALRNDGYDPEQMTIRHLLTHTSGLFDHSEPAAYSEAITAHPQHHWTRGEQLALSMKTGEPHGAPGEIYTYCDTGYILLGEIIEQASGQPLAEAVRELLGFAELGMSSTWWETLEAKPVGVPERAHQFLGELDTFPFHPSFDLYGGGGLACTVDDLERFTRALFTGGVYHQPGTAEVMLTTIDGARARPDADESAMEPGTYRMGIWVTEVDGLITYRHTGFWGTLATYVPELDLSLACTVNQNQGKESLVSLTEDTIRILNSKS